MSSLAHELACSYRPGDVFPLLGRLERCKLRWAGRFECRVDTSVGPVEVRGSRDVLLDVEEGSWLSLRLLREEDGVSVQSQQCASPLLLAAWLPDAACPQPAVLQRLRHLLGRLSPAGQALFMAVMPSASTQQRFFERPAATDHHADPGGLFVQSVAAAELAYTAWHPTEPDRDAATLTALLFDIGKLADPAVGSDLVREVPDLEPHPLTWLRLSAACDRIEPHDAGLASRVRALLVPTDANGDPRLRAVVDRAVTRSWLGFLAEAS